MLKKLLYEKNVLIPLKENKSPTITAWTSFNLENKVPFSRIEKSKNIGFVCGFNNVEVIDIDNHFGDADVLFQKIYDNYDVSVFPTIRTIGGGYHLYFRCENPRGNLKFAKRGIIENDETKHVIKELSHSVNTYGNYFVSLVKNKEGDWYGESTLIESRGVGGYVVCPPSHGYEIITGDLNNIPIISEDERFKFIGIISSLDELKKEVPLAKEIVASSDRIGDVYNADSSNFEVTKTILKNYGWTCTNKEDEWCRPGKNIKDGVSATFGKVGVNRFYIFSSNAHPFVEKESYSMFAVKAMLEFQGDYTACARSLAPEKNHYEAKSESKSNIEPQNQNASERQKRDDDDYIRIGDNYYKNVVMFDKYGNSYRKIVPRARQTIIDDHSKHILQSIKKFDDFCNVPSHNNYKPYVGNMYNMYNAVNNEFSEGEFPTIEKFMTHIFGEQLLMGYDYLQILWKEPTHILPVLCLVSKENETGKSTFGNFLQLIFAGNYANIGSGELNTEFNGSYASKLVAMIDEGYIAYKVIDKLKHMSTSPTIMLRQMRKDHTPIDFFCKFILCSNRVKEFIIANNDDERYWIRKITKFGSFDPEFLNKLKAETKHFLYFLNNRELSTKRDSRMHFSAESIRTEAFDDVVRNSIDVQTKDTIDVLLSTLESNSLPFMCATPQDLKETFFFNRSDISISKIRDILQEQFKLKSTKNPTNYQFLKGSNTKKGRYFTVDLETLKEQANINYEGDVFISPEHLRISK